MAIKKIRDRDPIAYVAMESAKLQDVDRVVIRYARNGEVLDWFDVTSREVGVERLGIVMDRRAFDQRLLKEARWAGAAVIYKRVTSSDIEEFKKTYDAVIDARGYAAWQGARCRGMEYTVQWWIPERRLGDSMVIDIDESIKAGYAWYFPAGERGAKYGFGELIEEYPKRKQVILRSVEKLWGLRPWESEEKVTYAAALPLCGQVRIYEEPNLFYVGTAAGLIDPATGAGIKYAILSARALANAFMAKGIKWIRALYVLQLTPILAEIKILKSIRKQYEENGASWLYSQSRDAIKKRRGAMYRLLRALLS